MSIVLILALVSLVVSFIGAEQGYDFYSVSRFGQLLAVAGVSLDSLFLVLSLD
jgi:hypothetical protein